MPLLAHVRQHCPPQSYHDEYARKDESPFKAYTALSFTGRGAPLLSDIARTIAGDDGRFEVNRQPQKAPRTGEGR